MQSLRRIAKPKTRAAQILRRARLAETVEAINPIADEAWALRLEAWKESTDKAREEAAKCWDHVCDLRAVLQHREWMAKTAPLFAACRAA